MEQPDDQRQLAIHGHGLLVPIPEETSPGTRGHGGRERCARGSTSPTAASDDSFRRIAELAVPMTDSRRGAGRRTAGLHPRYVEGAAAGSAILESALAELPRKPRIAALTSSGKRPADVVRSVLDLDDRGIRDQVLVPESRGGRLEGEDSLGGAVNDQRRHVDLGQIPAKVPSARCRRKRTTRRGTRRRQR